MKLEFSLQFFEKYANIKFHENPSHWSRVVPFGRMDGRTDITKLTVAFRNFANAPKNYKAPNKMQDYWHTAVSVLAHRCVCTRTPLCLRCLYEEQWVDVSAVSVMIVWTWQ
jgi:hypothetical protein